MAAPVAAVAAVLGPLATQVGGALSKGQKAVVGALFGGALGGAAPAVLAPVVRWVALRGQLLVGIAFGMLATIGWQRWAARGASAE